MAKKKAKRRPAIKRRRSVSGIMPGKSEVMTVAGVIGGLVAASLVADQLPATIDDKAKSALILAGGVLLLKQKNDLVKGAAMGLAAVGGYKLANSLLPAGSKLPAIGNTTRYLTFNNPVSGFNDYPNNPQKNTISGFNNFPNNPQRNTISGVPGTRAAGAGL